MNNIIIAILIVVLSVVSANATTPTISNVTGTVSQGQTLTITGTTMVDVSTTGWGSGLNTTNTSFEGSSLSSDGVWTASGSCAYTSGTKLIGSKSLDCNNVGASTWASQNNDYVWTDSVAQGGNNFCIRSYTAYDTSSGNGTWPDQDLKYWWVPGTSDTIFFQPNTNGGSAPTQWWAYMGDSLNTTANNPSGQFENGRWYCTEYCIMSNGTVNVWVDGQQIITGSTSTRSAGSSYVSLGVVTQWDTTSAYAMHQYLDGVAWGTQRLYPLSKIEIADGSTYATATKVYQQPLALGDTSQQVKVNLTGLGAGPYYLFVTNNKQETSAAYSLSGSDTTAPSTTISTSDPSATSTGSLTVAGTSSDAVGVSGCKWRIGAAPDGSNGTSCTGTTSFSCATSGYSNGANTLHVACYDAAGNYGDDSITVNYTPPIAAMSGGCSLSGGSIR